MRLLLLGLASVCFISVLPHRIVRHEKWKGGGFLGSLAGWGLFWLLPEEGPVLWATLLLVSALSIPICGYAERQWTYDDPRIVLDELVGVWIACLGLPRAWGPMLAGLILFRVFDVWKGPWGRNAARLPGGWGVVADDVAAGLIAALLVRAGMWGGLFS